MVVLLENEVSFRLVECEAKLKFGGEGISVNVFTDPLYCREFEDVEYSFPWYKQGEYKLEVKGGYFFTASGYQLKTLIVSFGAVGLPVTSIVNEYRRVVVIDGEVTFFKLDDMYNVLRK